MSSEPPEQMGIDSWAGLGRDKERAPQSASWFTCIDGAMPAGPAAFMQQLE